MCTKLNIYSFGGMRYNYTKYVLNLKINTYFKMANKLINE